MKVLSNKEGIGIVGLGVLGSAIAENFINKNIQISGYDISRKSLEKVAKKKNCYI